MTPVIHLGFAEAKGTSTRRLRMKRTKNGFAETGSPQQTRPNGYFFVNKLPTWATSLSGSTGLSMNASTGR